jgi:hypothetical protein
MTIIESRPGAPRRAALWVLLDWWGTFQPEPGYEFFVAESGKTVELIPALIGEVVAAKPMISEIPAQDPVARKPALQLLKCIEAGWVALEY